MSTSRSFLLLLLLPLAATSAEFEKGEDGGILIPPNAEMLLYSGSINFGMPEGCGFRDAGNEGCPVGDMEAQGTAILQGFKERLEGRGWSMENVVRVNVYGVAGADGELDFAGFNRAFAKFFSRELGHYIVLAEQEGLDLTAVEGSYAGAMGIPQFIPSSYREYSVDFDGDGRRDLIHSVADAIGSVAAYLARHGWVAGGPIAVPAETSGDGVAALVKKGIKPHSTLSGLAEGGVRPATSVDDSPGKAAVIELRGRDGTEHWIGFRNFYAITRYNHSRLYAMAVHQLASAIAGRRDGGG